MQQVIRIDNRPSRLEARLQNSLFLPRGDRKSKRVHQMENWKEEMDARPGANPIPFRSRSRVHFLFPRSQFPI